jgi:hypothetical protein
MEELRMCGGIIDERAEDSFIETYKIKMQHIQGGARTKRLLENEKSDDALEDDVVARLIAFCGTDMNTTRSH